MATLDLELHIGDALKALTVTLLPCRLAGESTCFALGTDITEHRALHRALEASGELLRRQAAALEDANTALRVILEQRNKDRVELERTILTNARTMVVPLLERLQKKLASAPEVIYADAAIQNLNELVYPFAESLDALAGSETWLSVREREIANLIRAGKSSSEIAEALFISPTTVAFHRKNLRRKFGLAATVRRWLRILRDCPEARRTTPLAATVGSASNRGRGQRGRNAPVTSGTHGSAAGSLHGYRRRGETGLRSSTTLTGPTGSQVSHPRGPRDAAKLVTLLGSASLDASPAGRWAAWNPE